jgi:MscS family membrane protein
MDVSSFFQDAAWSREYLNFKLWQWVGALGVVFLGYFFKYLTEWLIPYIERLASKTKTNLDNLIIEAITKPGGWLVASGTWWFGFELVQFKGALDKLLDKAVLIVFCYSIVLLAYNFVEILGFYLDRWAKRSDTNLDDQIVDLVKKTLRVSVLAFGLLVSLQSLGLNVMSVLAGLGIGGLALALAAKDTAANFFGSIMILIDRPFKVGDWIKVGEADGTVEQIGLRSTRIRTFYMSQISIPNSLVATVQVDNMGRRPMRRVFLKIGLEYSTPMNKMQDFVKAVREYLKAHKDVDQNMHVYFNDYKDSSLEVMVYFFLRVPTWSEELAGREVILGKIYEIAKEVGVGFAFPTRTLHLVSEEKVKSPQVPDFNG